MTSTGLLKVGINPKKFDIWYSWLLERKWEISNYSKISSVTVSLRTTSQLDPPHKPQFSPRCTLVTTMFMLPRKPFLTLMQTKKKSVWNWYRVFSVEDKVDDSFVSNLIFNSSAPFWCKNVIECQRTNPIQYLRVSFSNFIGLDAEYLFGRPLLSLRVLNQVGKDNVKNVLPLTVLIMYVEWNLFEIGAG